MAAQGVIGVSLGKQCTKLVPDGRDGGMGA
jgi:hypothetical protein